jgi:hypothetical protein
MEFRCFVKDHKLIGISQREITSQYDYLQDGHPLKRTFYDKIQEFYNELIGESHKDWHNEDNSSYIFDVFVDVPPRYKVWLIDINPWIPDCIDSLLFNWNELD